MTTNRDLDRNLGAWFEARATSAAPDGLLERGLARVDATRQRPGWLVGAIRVPLSASGRFVVVPAWVMVLLIVVATIAAVATGASLFRRTSPAVIDLSPTPTTTLVPSANPSPLPPGLQSRWVGQTRQVVQITPPTTMSALELSSLTIRYLGGGDPILLSAAAMVGPDTISLRLSQDGAGCRIGDLGTYTFTLSGSGRALSVEAITDGCAARVGAISGRWVKAACPNTNSLCLGDLDPGEHASAAFNPFVARAKFRYEYGRLTYSVPDGWSDQVDGPDGYILSKQSAPNDSAIYLFSTALADSQAIGCPGTIEPGVGHTSAALATWLTKLPGLATTKPVPVAVGGLSGFALDVAVRPTWTRTCPYSNGKPYVALFTNGDSTNNFDWGLTAGGRMRLFLLDLPDGRTLLIDVEAQDRATWDALVRDAMPVIQSFQFHP